MDDGFMDAPSTASGWIGTSMQRFWSWVLAVLGRRGSSTRPEDPMLNYFLTQIEVRLRWLTMRVSGDPDKEEILALIRTGLNEYSERPELVASIQPDEAWSRAYRLERLLALAEPEDTLYSETQRRLEEAVDEGVLSAARLRAALTAALPQLVDTAQSPPALKPGGGPQLRAVLLDILEEIHWTMQRKFHGRPIQKSATRRLVAMGLGACVLFLLPYIYIYIRSWLSDVWPLPFWHWAWLPLWTAVTAGFFGAMFSRLLYLQTNWNVLSLGAIKDARDFWSIFLRGAVGMTGAVIVYYFLQSGVIDGSLFPKFNQIHLTQMSFIETSAKNPSGDLQTLTAVPLRLILPNTQLALLVVWSFLAGFSERLVPSILQSTETSLREGTAGRK